MTEIVKCTTLCLLCELKYREKDCHMYAVGKYIFNSLMRRTSIILVNNQSTKTSNKLVNYENRKNIG